MTHGFIYFIQAAETNRYKIGFTSRNPQIRLRELQTGSAIALNLRHFWKASYADEQGLHETLKNFRVQGEWFELDLGKLVEAMTWTRQEILKPYEDLNNAYKVSDTRSSIIGEYGAVLVTEGPYKGLHGYYSGDTDEVECIAPEYSKYTTIQEESLAVVYLDELGEEVYLPHSSLSLV